MPENKTYTIFLVDDDSKHLLVLKDHLSKHLPYKLDIKTFTDGEESLRHLDENPHMVVLDYYFDSTGDNSADGVEILKKLRKKKPNLPVVMMSHQDKLEVAVTCYEYGVKDYIIKNETANVRAQIVIRNIIYELIKEDKAGEYRKGAQLAQYVLGGFIVLLLGVIIYMARG